MIKPNHEINWGLGLIKPPAYPFTAQKLYADLHARLQAESGEKISFERLGQIIGRSKSTAHHWFGVSSQQLVIAWLCLLERLSVRARLDFLEAHCRIFPTLEHRRFVHAPSKTGKMLELVRQKTGLTFVCGGSDAARTFVVTAMGHSYRNATGERLSPSGIDVHCPRDLVPVETLVYINNTQNLQEIRRLILSTWQRVQTSSGKLIILNGVWNRVAEIQKEILRCAKRNHVLVAEPGTPDLNLARIHVSTPLHLVTISAAKCDPHGLRASCRRLKPLKRLQNQGSL